MNDEAADRLELVAALAKVTASDLRCGPYWSRHEFLEVLSKLKEHLDAAGRQAWRCRKPCCDPEG